MRDRDLVRLHWPVELRPAFDSLFDIDEAMGDVVVRATQPALAAIKLAWWRERLEGLDEGQVPAEPHLQAAAKELLPKGITGHELARLEQGWAELLAERPDVEKALDRGARLFQLAGHLLGAEMSALNQAGRLFAAGNLKRRSLPFQQVAISDLPKFPRSARRLTGMAALAIRDLRGGETPEAEATPGRAWTLLRHRITGRL